MHRGDLEGEEIGRGWKGESVHGGSEPGGGGVGSAKGARGGSASVQRAQGATAHRRNGTDRASGYAKVRSWSRAVSSCPTGVNAFDDNMR
jgi:hypothetical protein